MPEVCLVKNTLTIQIRQNHTTAVGCLYINIKFRKKEET